MLSPAIKGGATQNLGTTTGCYDAGRASGWQVAGAAANWGTNALMAATSFETEGESLEAGEGLGLLEESGGAGFTSCFGQSARAS